MGANDQGADAIENRWLTIPRTLCFVFYGDDVLLMKRAPHKRVFPNKFNGLGGHIERHEDPLSAARREILEESSLDVQHVRLRAVHHIDAGENTGIMLFVFTAQSDSRDFRNSSDEGTLQWVAVSQLDAVDLVEDLPLILPRILTMKDDDAPYSAHVSYNEHDEIVMRFVVD